MFAYIGEKLISFDVLYLCKVGNCWTGDQMQCVYDSSNICDLYEYYGNRPCDICGYCRNHVCGSTVSKPLNKSKDDEVDLNIDLTEFYNFDTEEPCIRRKKVNPIQSDVDIRAAPTTKNASVGVLLWEFFFGWISRWL